MNSSMGRGARRPNPSQNQSIAVVVGRTGNGSGDGTGTEGSTVRAGTQRYGRATERAQRSPPDKTAKTPLGEDEQEPGGANGRH